MPTISYAQNFEDVMLWRALGHVANGSYIDVGAQHPLIDSVSRMFYEKGWRGVHIEAQLHYAALLQQDRPDELVLPVALSDRKGLIKFYQVPVDGGGLSTGDRATAEVHRVTNRLEINEILAPTLTLDDVFLEVGPREIHWLKIDVEGMEAQVIDGWTTTAVKPWIVVIESTFPMTGTPTHGDWEQKILDRGYVHAYWDGLNRYYVAVEHSELIQALSTPPNVFDDFSFSGLSHAPFCKHLKTEFSGLLREAKDAAAQSQGLLEDATRTLVAQGQQNEAANRLFEREKLSAELERELLQRLTDKDASGAERDMEAANRLIEQVRVASERERELLQRLVVHEASAAERDGEAASRLLEQARIASERERELLQRLVDHEASAAERDGEAASRLLEQARIASERERELMQRLVDQERDFITRYEGLQKRLRATKRKLGVRKRQMLSRLREFDTDIIQMRDRLTTVQTELDSFRAAHPWRLFIRAVKSTLF